MSFIANLLTTASRRSGGGGTVSYPTPLRVADTHGRAAGNSATAPAGKENFIAYVKFGVAGDQYALKPSFHAFVVGSGSIAALGNDINITKSSLISNTGQVLPCYKNGTRAYVIPNGSKRFDLDAVDEALVTGGIDGDTDWWIKFEGYVAAGAKIPLMNYTLTDVTNAQTHWYGSGTTLTNSADDSGPYTYTGTAPQSANIAFKPIILGYPKVDDMPRVMVGGDSMNDGDGDNTSNDHFGRGQTQRININGSGKTYIAVMNFAKSGSSFQNFADNDFWEEYVECANVFTMASGTNNVDSNSTAQMTSYHTTIRNKVKAKNATIKYFVQEMLLRTNTTDDWATLANQAPINANWDVGGKVETMNASYHTLRAAGTIDFVIDYSVLRYGVQSSVAPYSAIAAADRWKWPIVKLYNADSTHLNTAGANAQGLINRAAYLGVFKKYNYTGVAGIAGYWNANNAASFVDTGSSKTWTDEKNGYVLDESTSAGYAGAPTYGTDARGGYLLFNGTGGLRNSSAFTQFNAIGSATNAMMVLSEVADASAAQNLFMGYSGGSQCWGLDIGEFAGFYTRMFNAGNNTDNHARSGSTNVPIIDAGRKTGTGSNDLQSFTASGNITSTTPNYTAITHGLFLGWSSNGSNPLRNGGKIRKVIAWTTNPSNALMKEVATAMAAEVPATEFFRLQA